MAKYGIYRPGHGFYLCEYDSKKDARALADNLNTAMVDKALKRKRKKTDDEVIAELILYEVKPKPVAIGGL